MGIGAQGIVLQREDIKGERNWISSDSCFAHFWLVTSANSSLRTRKKRSEIQIRKAYKLILSRLKQKEYSKFYDRRSYRRRIFHNNHRELPDVKIGGLKHDNIVSYQTRLQIIKCFHLNDILFHVLGKLVHQIFLLCFEKPIWTQL